MSGKVNPCLRLQLQCCEPEIPFPHIENNLELQCGPQEAGLVKHLPDAEFYPRGDNETRSLHHPRNWLRENKNLMIQLFVFFSLEESCYLSQCNTTVLCSGTPVLVTEVCGAVHSNFVYVFCFQNHYILFDSTDLRPIDFYVFYIYEILLALVLENFFLRISGFSFHFQPENFCTVDLKY